MKFKTQTIVSMQSGLALSHSPKASRAFTVSWH
jgi:hypothetical protein